MAESTPTNMMRARAVAVRRWLAAPITRVVRARGTLAQAEILSFYRTELVSPVEHLTSLPPIGSMVRLIEDSWFLRDRHGAVIGSVGKVVDHSRLSREDNDGVLVDWGTGHSVRCMLGELGLAHSNQVTA